MEEEDDGGPGIPEWVVTFGDMMSLLLTFFIMLVSISEIKQEELYQALVDSLRRRFGHDASSASMAPGESKPRNSQVAKLASQGRAKRMDTMDGGDKVQAPTGDYSRVQIIRDGDDVTKGGTIRFGEFSTEIDDEQSARLRVVIRELAGKSQQIEVRGHTSRQPLPDNAPYADHMELAFARARKVMEFLAAEGIDPVRIRLTAAGGNEPLTTKPDPVEQRRNDRVEVFLLEQTAEAYVPPETTTPAAAVAP